ncbi:MAG: EI24 domain-containing protein [Alphaproteobacteria bacterium]|nr:EI24 domain-containing protein [Alphaproteobacteria bacterium]
MRGAALVLGAASDVFGQPLRGIGVLCAGLAITLIVGLVWAALTYLVPLIPWQGWVGFGAEAAASVAVVALAVVLAPLVAMILGGVLLDVAAGRVERLRFPDEPGGKSLALPQALAAALRIGCVALPLNLLALPLMVVPVLGLAVYWLLNGYLLGREYFSLAALRFRPWPEAAALRRKSWGAIFAAGLCLAVWMTIPVLNALTPLFGIALMVRLHKAVSPAQTAA